MQAVASRMRTGYVTGRMLFPFLGAILAPARATDEILLRRIAARDPKALRELYDRAAPVALAVAQRILRSAPEAQDVLQDAFVEAWRNASQFDARRGTAVAWLIAITRSRALDRLRARAASDRARTALKAEEPPAVPLPIESATQRQERDRLQQALETLPSEQRDALQLAYFEGLTQVEIAARLGEPLGTVKTRCRLALTRLAGILGETAS